jgi:hypothetical protein
MDNQLPGGPGYFESGSENDINPWESSPEQAFDNTIRMAVGHGIVWAGTIMAMNMSAGGNKGKTMPYVPDNYDGMDVNPHLVAGRTFLSSDIADGATTLSVVNADSYRFVVGDEICVDDDGTTTPENLGAITAIDRTTSSVIATITFTNPVTASGGFAVANKGCVYVNGNKSALLASDFTTGTDLVVSNANAKGFKKGDILYAVSDTVDAVSLGAITAITKGATNTTITITTDPAGSFTTAQNGMVYVMGDTLQTAYCVLGAGRQTGYGELTGYASVSGVGVFKNAKFNMGALGNYDDRVADALGGREVEQIFMI